MALTPASAIGTAATVAGLLTSSKRIDVTQILDQQNMLQVFGTARPMRAHVAETSKVMDYPVETGATLSDNRVSNPTEIEMDFFIPSTGYATVYPQMRNAWLAATLLSVQTKTGTYKNMIIKDMPHEEDPEMFNAIMMRVRFMEVIMIAPSTTAASPLLANYSPAQPQAVNTVNTGLIQGIAATGSALSYFHAASIVGL